MAVLSVNGQDKKVWCILLICVVCLQLWLWKVQITEKFIYSSYLDHNIVEEHSKHRNHLLDVDMAAVDESVVVLLQVV